MNQPMGRRDAMKLAALGLAAGVAPGADTRWAVKAQRQPFAGLKVGITSYTTRKLTLDQTIAALRQMGIGYISIKDMHLPMNTTREERAAVRKKIEDSGLKIRGCGVISLRNDEAEIRRALEYVRDAGAPMAVTSPEPAALKTLDKVVKDFDLRVAIHNHGPEDKKFPSALGVLEAVQGLDRKIGCCVDVGHTFRLGEDPAQTIRKVASRLYDVHIKDLSAPERQKDVPVGTGVMDLVAILKALVDIKFKDHVALEYEAEAENPVPGMASSFGYIRGVLAML